MTEELTSLAGRRVKQVLELKQKKYRERYGLFLMEGVRSVEDAVSQKIENGALYVTHEAAALSRVSEIIGCAKILSWDIFFVTDAIMKACSGTEHGQGIFAVLPIPKRKLSDISAAPSDTFVLLDGVQDPGNMGTILRTAAAAGVTGVILTVGSADPYEEKAVRASMGSILRLPVYTRVTLDELDEFLRRNRLPLFAMMLEGGKPYRDVSGIVGGVFAFGNEGAGISKEVAARADVKLYVPMAAGVESLNVAVCAGIVLFHFKR